MIHKQKTDYNLIESLLTLLSISKDSSADPDGLTASAPQTKDAASQSLYNFQAIIELKNFVDQMPGGFFIYRADESEEILYANKSLLRMFQCDTLKEFRQLTGNSFKGIVYHEDLEEVEQSIKEQIAQSQYDLDYVEYRIVQKNGTMRWIEDYGHFVHSSMGDVFYVFIGDATKKRERLLAERNALLDENIRKEQKLQSRIEKYDKTLKLINQEYLRRLEVIEGLSANYDSILYIDLDQNKVLPYRLGNQAKRQFENQFLPKDFTWYVSDYIQTWVHPDDKELLLKLTDPAYIRRELSVCKTYYANYRIINHNEIQYLQLRIVNVSPKEPVSQVVLGYQRVDEEIRHQMEQKQILEEALHNANLSIVARNAFLSNMSHDMRTPLNAILGLASLAKNQLKDQAPDQEKLSGYFDKIETAGTQLLKLVEETLELAQAESAQTRVVETPFDLHDVLREIRNTFLPRAESKNIAFSLNTAGLEHFHVCSDKEKLKQLLTHIIGNAIKYTPENGRVTLTAMETENSSSEYTACRFIIEDNGIGIAKEFIDHIFEPFAREKNTTFSGIHGTGLGLTIAKNIARILGGDIEVSSIPGEGSRFTVTLGLRIPDLASCPHHIPKEVSKPLHTPRILIVEDNEINLEIETEMLKSSGFDVDTAMDGSAAFDKVRNSLPGDYDLILMDIQMPVMDGRTAAKAIRSLLNPGLSQIPIIALSADAFEKDKQKSIECGMNAHLTKPVNLALLLDAISGLIGLPVKHQ